MAVNGCEGFAGDICSSLHTNATPSGSHALTTLCAKTCKGLRAFWLGTEAPEEPEAKAPSACSGEEASSELAVASLQSCLQPLPSPTSLLGKEGSLSPSCNICSMPEKGPALLAPYLHPFNASKCTASCSKRPRANVMRCAEAMLLLALAFCCLEQN